MYACMHNNNNNYYNNNRALYYYSYQRLNKLLSQMCDYMCTLLSVRLVFQPSTYLPKTHPQ